MRRLGYPLTYPTKCFINGGCAKPVFAHTNGHGDFVLFDELAWPWPIHECYFYRTPNDGGPSPASSWEQVRPVEPDPDQHKKLEIVGTLTNYDEAKMGSLRQFRDLPSAAKERVRQQLGECKSLITVVTGHGFEYLMFADMRNVVAAVGQTVGVRLKAMMILNTPVFKATQIKVIPMS